MDELTRRECQILLLVMDGLSNGEIGTRLGIKPATVKKHLERVYIKLGVSNRTGAAIQGLRLKPANTKNDNSMKTRRPSKRTKQS